MLILGIETSCDETGAAVVKDGREIISSAVASSEELHKKYGGILPEVAAREQVKWIVPIIDEAVKKARNIKTISGIDAIAVTVGPGLIGSLLVGVETAKTLAFALDKPLVPVNHLLAHFYAAWLESQTPEFPLIGLLASGGHTDLVLMKNHGRYRWLGGTRDDAAGECFDKAARLLDLGYPGGPAIQTAATTIKTDKTPLSGKGLPRPMLNQDNLDFSFSGLKTAVLHEVKEGKRKRNELAFEVQEAITDVLVKKTIKAVQNYQVNTIVVAGGVAANQRLKEKFRATLDDQLPTTKLFIPPPPLCTDNAATLASCAFFNFHPIPWQKIQAVPSLSL